MVSDLVENESNVRVNRKMELVTVPENAGGNAMIGISYLTKEDADTVSARTEELCKKPQYDGSFWEEALYNKDRMIVAAGWCIRQMLWRSTPMSSFVKSTAIPTN